MKGYNPNIINGNVLNEEINNEKNINNKNIVNDSVYHENMGDVLINDTISQKQDKSLNNTVTNKNENILNDNLNNKSTKSNIKDKINKGAQTTEASIDKIRDFLVNLYMKYTQKPQEYSNYDAENVVNKEYNLNPENKTEISEVNNKFDDGIFVSKTNKNDFSFTSEEIAYLKSLIKEKQSLNTENVIKYKLNNDEKINLINKIINNDIIEDINNEFEKVFNEPLIKNSNKEIDTDELQTSLENIKPTTNQVLHGSDNTINSSPIPSPFDPVKIDEENESKQEKQIYTKEETLQKNQETNNKLYLNNL